MVKKKRFDVRLLNDDNIGLLEHALRFLLVLILLGFSTLYFNNTYPISEGWGVFNAELLSQGKVAYRDFYYYLPPLSLWMDALFWKLSFGMLLVFRAWRLAERIAIYILVYNFLKRYFHCVYAFVACAFTAVLSTGDVYDLFGDYNQTMALLAILLLYAATTFAHAKALRGRLKWLFISGMIIGGMFLNKQTIFLASFICYFICLTAFCLKTRDKNWLRYCVSVAVGMLVPIGITAVYLLSQNALIPFLDQVYINTDGKGSLFGIIVQSVYSKIFGYGVWVLSILPLLWVSYRRTMPGEIIRDKNHDAVAKCFAAVNLLIYVEFYHNPMKSMLEAIAGGKKSLVIVAAGIIGFVGCAWFFRHKRIPPKKRRLLNTLVGAACAILVLTGGALDASLMNRLAERISIFDYIQYDLSRWSFYSMIVLFIVALTMDWEKTRGRDLLFIACGGMSLYYAGVMAAGVSPGPAHIFRIALPVILCVVLAHEYDNRLVCTVIKGLAWVSCVALSLMCITQKSISAYSWWGSADSPRWEKTYSTDIPALKGIRLSISRKELYEWATNTINENSDEDAFVWGYPHIKLFNILTDRYDMETFVPVLFPDVVSDKYVLLELEQLKQHLPDIVVWEDIPTMLEANAGAFRNGVPLKQAELEAYFAEILPKKYKSLGSYENVTIYKKK